MPYPLKQNKGAPVDASSAVGQAVGLAMGGRLLPCQPADHGVGGSSFRPDPSRAKLGAADAEAAVEAQRPQSRVARGRGYKRAYEYLRQRTKHMQYWEYRWRHLPIGSGITEAACKTVFTQRLKLSGMRWKHEGAGIVLTLRVILLSGIWEEVYGATLESYATPPVRTYEVPHTRTLTIAA